MTCTGSVILRRQLDVMTNHVDVTMISASVRTKVETQQMHCIMSSVDY